ncbi:MAG: hypothetical protein LBH61_07435, partial [Dysgonamonadaceae bacterium]|nr:hypothetical protein [Dysgonamonadaceae bacterium]
ANRGNVAAPGRQNLGLLLPNVELSDDASAFVLGSSVTGEPAPAARGMVVYNTASVLNGPGLYVWDGSSLPHLKACRIGDIKPATHS